MLGRSLTRRARDWHSSDVLKARLEQYADAIYRQFPYHPDMLALKVHGHAVVASQLQTALRQVVGLADVVEHLLATDREGAGQEAQRVLEQLQREVEEQEEARRRAEDEAAEAERLALRAQGGLAACEPGIHVGVSHTSTLLHCVQGQQDACELNLTNKVRRAESTRRAGCRPLASTRREQDALSRPREVRSPAAFAGHGGLVLLLGAHACGATPPGRRRHLPLLVCPKQQLCNAAALHRRRSVAPRRQRRGRAPPWRGGNHHHHVPAPRGRCAWLCGAAQPWRDLGHALPHTPPDLISPGSRCGVRDVDAPHRARAAGARARPAHSASARRGHLPTQRRAGAQRAGAAAGARRKDGQGERACSYMTAAKPAPTSAASVH